MNMDKMCLIVLAVLLIAPACDGDGNGNGDADATDVPADDAALDDAAGDADGDADVEDEEIEDDMQDVVGDVPAEDADEDVPDVQEEEIPAATLLDEFCTDVAEAVCDYITGCCTRTEEEALISFIDCSDPGDSSFFHACYDDLASFVVDGSVQVYEGAIPGCVGMFTGLATDCPNFNASFLHREWYIQAGCSEVLRGALSPSEDCYDSEQCQGSYYCDKSEEPYTCAPKPGAGGACEDNAMCMTNNVCVNGECASPSARGGLCDEDGDCTLGLYCDADAGGLCRSMLPAETECDTESDYCEGMCEDGDPGSCVDYCNGV
ncbi:MAG: dickkopf-related protein [Pseudomonadota bacterium]